MRSTAILIAACAMCARAQEAESGFELRTTVTGSGIVSNQLSAPPRSGSEATAGMRAMLYPTWKLNEHWTVAGAVQVRTTPYYLQETSTQTTGVRGDLLQAHLGYSRF